MTYGLYLSAAGANAQSHRLEVLSNNLANINTAGFKPHLTMLSGQESAAIANGDATLGAGTVDDLGGGIELRPSVTQFSEGPIRGTGNKTDFAINDKESFFAIENDGKELLTRAGNFLFDSRGTLVTPNGDAVVAQGGGQIRIDPNLPYEIMDDGAILQAGTRQAVKLVQPRSLGDLSRVGQNMYESLTPVNEVANEKRNIISGSLETSAVEPTSAMMELIEASRVYEANVRMIQSQDDATGNLISRLLK